MAFHIKGGKVSKFSRNTTKVGNFALFILFPSFFPLPIEQMKCYESLSYCTLSRLMTDGDSFLIAVSISIENENLRRAASLKPRNILAE